MDEARYRVREFRDTDYESLARIRNRHDPDSPHSSAELRHFDEAFAAPHLLRRRFVVEETGSASVVAVAFLEQRPFNYHPRKFWAEVIVDPDHERRGIGGSLYSLLVRAAAAHGAIGLWARVKANDPGAVRFFERNGFVEQRRTWRSRLDLTSLDLTAFPDRTASLVAQGVRFTTLEAEGSDRPEVRERYYVLHRSTGEDVPNVGKPTPLSFEQFVRLVFGGPGYLPEATFLARVGDAYVSVTALYQLEGRPDTVQVGFTGTLRAYRGKGLATELKLRSIRYARARGYHWMETGNDSKNPAIWAINERLGFRVELTTILGEKSLSPSP